MTAILSWCVPSSALCWGRLDRRPFGRWAPWSHGFGHGSVFMRFGSWTEWFLRVGPFLLAFRDHRVVRPLFSERHGIERHAWYWHVGPYCLHIKWKPLIASTNGS